MVLIRKKVHKYLLKLHEEKGGANVVWGGYNGGPEANKGFQGF